MEYKEERCLEIWGKLPGKNKCEQDSQRLMNLVGIPIMNLVGIYFASVQVSQGLSHAFLCKKDIILLQIILSLGSFHLKVHTWECKF